jgi:hypothetical protein
MTKILDQTGDLNGQQLYRLSRLYPLPPFVKAASSDDIYGSDELHSHQFADPAHRQFPCHTGPATYISALFFLDKKASMDPDEATFVNGRLDDLAFFHGINERVDALRTKLADAQKLPDINQLPDDIFALVMARDGVKERHYPLRNALEVKAAAEMIEKYREVIPYEHRQTMAEKVLDKAAEYGAGLGDLDGFLHKQAGHGAAAGLDVAQFLFDRARLLKRANKITFAEQVAKMASTVAHQPAVAHDSNSLIKLASLVDQVDRESGLSKIVDDLPRPEDVFFGITEKAASEMLAKHFTTTSGNIYKTADVSALKLDAVRDVMGEDFAQAISSGGLFVSPEKVADIVPTLPRGDAELFDRLLGSYGVGPKAKEAAHEGSDFSLKKLRKMASLHARAH